MRILTCPAENRGETERKKCSYPGWEAQRNNEKHIKRTWSLGRFCARISGNRAFEKRSFARPRATPPPSSALDLPRTSTGGIQKHASLIRSRPGYVPARRLQPSKRQISSTTSACSFLNSQTYQFFSIKNAWAHTLAQPMGEFGTHDSLVFFFPPLEASDEDSVSSTELNSVDHSTSLFKDFTSILTDRDFYVYSIFF